MATATSARGPRLMSLLRASVSRGLTLSAAPAAHRRRPFATAMADAAQALRRLARGARARMRAPARAVLHVRTMHRGSGPTALTAVSS